jgi:hypothetical protein
MQVNVYWNHPNLVANETGIMWVEASGPEGSVAVGGGGYVSFSGTGVDDTPFLPIIASQPVEGYPNAWKFGVNVPCGRRRERDHEGSLLRYLSRRSTGVKE